MRDTLKILRQEMNKPYCGSTRYDYLDEEEKEMIHKAMVKYAALNKVATSQPIIIAEQSEATVCPRCAEFRKTHGKDSECIPCGLKRINNRQTG